MTRQSSQAQKAYDDAVNKFANVKHLLTRTGRVTIAELDFQTYCSLTRNQRQALRMRGWYARDWGKRNQKVNHQAFEVQMPKLIREAGYIAYELRCLRGMPFPHWIGPDDLSQEAILYLFQRSAHPGLTSSRWRTRVIRNRLRNLQLGFQRQQRTFFQTVSFEELR